MIGLPFLVMRKHWWAIQPKRAFPDTCFAVPGFALAAPVGVGFHRLLASCKRDWREPWFRSPRQARRDERRVQITIVDGALVGTYRAA